MTEMIERHGRGAIPALRGGLPILGRALDFQRDPVSLLMRGRDDLGDIFHFRLFGKTVYALLSPAGNAAFFRAPDDQLGQRDAYRFMVPIFGRGVAYDVDFGIDGGATSVRPSGAPRRAHAGVCDPNAGGGRAIRTKSG